MRLLLYRNCQMLSVFSFEPSNGVASLPCWNLETLRGLWCLRVWKRIKCIRSSSGSPLFLRMFIFTMPRPVVWLWKWGSKYLKRGNQMLRRLAHDSSKFESKVRKWRWRHHRRNQRQPRRWRQQRYQRVSDGSAGGIPRGWRARTSEYGGGAVVSIFSWTVAFE